MKISVSRLILAGFCVASLSACATVTRGPKQTLYILSEPTAAKVEMTNGQRCKTPCKLKLKRKNEFTANITKEGFKPISVPVENSIKAGGAAGAAGNVIAGGVIGIFVDGSNGSLLTLRPNPINVVLVKSDATGESRLVETTSTKAAAATKGMKALTVEQLAAERAKEDAAAAAAAPPAPAPAAVAPDAPAAAPAATTPPATPAAPTPTP